VSREEIGITIMAVILSVILAIIVNALTHSTDLSAIVIVIATLATTYYLRSRRLKKMRSGESHEH
jgi:hypothetical protein